MEKCELRAVRKALCDALEIIDKHLLGSEDLTPIKFRLMGEKVRQVRILRDSIMPNAGLNELVNLIDGKLWIETDQSGIEKVKEQVKNYPLKVDIIFF